MEKIYYYVDCTCAHHERFQSFQNETCARDYYDKLSCPHKILYTETNDPEKPFHTLEESFKDNLK